jgi:hypothetical protein
MVDICEDDPHPYRSQKISLWFCQESCKKDVEEVFGMLQSHFSIVWYLAPYLVDISDVEGHDQGERERVPPVIDD